MLATSSSPLHRRHKNKLLKHRTRHLNPPKNGKFIYKYQHNTKMLNAINYFERPLLVTTLCIKVVQVILSPLFVMAAPHTSRIILGCAFPYPSSCPLFLLQNTYEKQWYALWLSKLKILIKECVILWWVLLQNTFYTCKLSKTANRLDKVKVESDMAQT